MPAASPMTSLREEHKLMTALLELLKQEQQHLLAADIEQLTELTARKAALVTQMAALAGQRHEALAAAGFPAQEEGMDAWLGSSDEAGAAPQWSALLDVTRSAKELNRINGMLVNKHLAHTQGALNAMNPASQSGNFYGPSGQTTTNASSRRFVAG